MRSLLRGARSSLLLIVFCSLIGCQSGEQPGATDTIDSGTIHISVDESFKPVIDSEVKVFESLHPDAHVIVDYKPEAQCIRDLKTDSVRMVIITRTFTESEENYIVDSLRVAPKSLPIARDAISVIVNPKSPDT
ncbi:MAG TPA: substrate-binding domain-containing protein, partial [Chitinophagaceae bacterium]